MSASLPDRRPMKVKPDAFTLVEIMVVVGIIAILSALIIPAVTGILKSNSLTAGGLLVQQTLTSARQYALTKNRRTEVRFFNYIDPASAFTNTRIQGFQTYEIDDNGTVTPVGKIRRLPEGIGINTSSQLSNLVADPSRQKTFTPPGDPKIPIPGNSTNYTATYVQFLPNGSTDLSTSAGGDSGKWYVTLQAINDGLTSSTPPANFFTVQIDPISGTLTIRRP